MTKVAEIQFAPWDKIYYFAAGEMAMELNDYIIVETKLGLEMGKAVGFKELTDAEPAALPDPLKPILRKATKEDLDVVLGQQKNRAKALEDCRGLIKKHNLPIKLIDVHFTFDGTRITFAFIADGRVDFRELLKDLIKVYHKNILLQQLGIRDEIKIMGDYGHCGKELCCRGHLKNLCSITSEMAEIQQCAHRGSERISGICGRLMCCLAYEQCGYEQLAQKLPPMGIKVNVDGKRGVIVGHHILKQSVDVQFSLQNKKNSLELR